jgi:hypothetical protein
MIRATAAAFVLAVIAAAAFFLGGPEFLRVDDGVPAEPADLAVALAGPADEDGRRIAAGVAFVRAEKARFLVLPVRHRALEWPWFVRHYRIEAPLGEDRVIVGRREGPGDPGSYDLGGTFTEAVRAVEIMRRQGFRSAIVVSSGYHIRRAKLAFERAGAGAPGIRFHFVPVEDDHPRGPLTWWRREGAVARVADEYLKLAGGYLFYR